MVAKGQDEAVAGEAGEVFGDLAHGNLAAALDAADGEFIGFADIQEQGAVAQVLGGGGDVDLDGNFHGGRGNLPPTGKKQSRWRTNDILPSFAFQFAVDPI
jgi:hypothetical protein